jgi:iron-sulfur cluster assembly accessory protein
MNFPIKITELALQKMLAARKADLLLTEAHALRVSCKGGGCAGFQYSLDFEDTIDETDACHTFAVGEDNMIVVVDEISVIYLKDLEIDYVQGEYNEGFKFNGIVKNTCGCGKSFSV